MFLKMNNFDRDERKKEFQRQQDRLKMMAPDPERKSTLMSADAMIDTLLQKSDTFRKVTDYPPWLQVNSPLCCPYYEKIWEIVKAGDQVVDTPRVSQLLLTSGLHPNILGCIWNLANKTSPGQLTKQELYIVLALVGLAQSRCTFNSLSVLNSIPTAPIPILHVPFQPVFNRSQPTLLSSPTVPAPHLPPQTPASLIRHPSSGHHNQPNSHLYESPLLDSYVSLAAAEPDMSTVNGLTAAVAPPDAIAPADETDDFADFQSADALDATIVQPNVKISSFIKVSPESERKLRNFSQPESLAALPESKISSKNQVSSVPSILSTSRTVGSRLANHSLQEKSKKHLKMKPDDLFGKCLPKSFVLKETKIPSIELDENTRKIEIPSVGTFKETILPVEKKKNEEVMLSMDEDKYGALRELEIGGKAEEDFGDFLSADLPSEKAVEAWNTWNQSLHETPKKIPDTGQAIDLLGDDLEIELPPPEIDEDFGDFVVPVTESVRSPVDFFPLINNLDLKPDPNFSIGEKCIDCCRMLLAEALDIFKCLDGAVLDEIFGTEKARCYVEGLRVVYFIAKRVNSTGSYFNDKFLEVQTFWEKISLLIPDSTEMFDQSDDLTDSCSLCAVCQTGTLKTDLEIDGKIYHPSCANLWVNFIETTLPCS